MTPKEEINTFLTEIFNKILKIEEMAIVRSGENSLSVSDLHIIEKIGKHGQKRMSDVALALGITLGTLTVATDRLEKKGYVERVRDCTDRRIVNIRLTHKGLAANRLHDMFHSRMVDEILKGLGDKELDDISIALSRLNDFFSKYSEHYKINKE